MPSKAVIDLTKLAHLAETAISTHLTAISKGVDEALSDADSKTKHEDNVRVMVSALLTTLKRRVAEAIRADELHLAELSDDAAPREERDRASADTFKTLSTIKQTVSMLFGEKTLKELRLSEELKNDTTLENVGIEVLGRLKKAKFPAPIVEGIGSVDPKPWIATLSSNVERLSTAIKQVATEASQARATQLAKDKALESCQEALTATVGLAQALARLGGKDSLLRGIRSTVQYNSSGESTIDAPTENNSVEQQPSQPSTENTAVVAAKPDAPTEPKPTKPVAKPVAKTKKRKRR